MPFVAFKAAGSWREAEGTKPSPGALFLPLSFFLIKWERGPGGEGSKAPQPATKVPLRGI